MCGGCASRESLPASQELEVCPVSPDDPTQSGCRQYLSYSDFPNPYPKTTPLTPEEAFALIKENQDNPVLLVIDLRAPSAFIEGHIEGSINIDYDSKNFQERLDKLDRDNTYLFYGKKDGYSANAANRIEEHVLGDTVYYISGGLDGWLAEGLPIVE